MGKQKHYIACLPLIITLCMGLSIELRAEQQTDRQLQVLSRELFKTPQNPALLMQRGDLYFQRHEFENAIADYSAAIAIAPSLSKAYFGRGMALGRLGKVREGIADLSIYLQHRPDSSLGYTKRGVRYLWIGEQQLAEQDFRKAIALNPANAEAHDDLGVILAQKGRFDEALLHFKQTITHDPSYQKGYHNLALTHLVSGDPSRALSRINAAIQLQPDNRNSILLKAEILNALGQHEQAMILQQEAEYLPEGNWSELAPDL